MLVPQRSALPGFAPTFGVTLLWLSLIVLIPLAALIVRPWELGLAGFWHSVTEPRVLAALRLSFGTAAIAAAINLPFGLLIAWVMVRYRFPGRNVADSLIDMPLALPTAVAGISLTALFAPKGWIGALLLPLGIKVAYTPLGILIALIFVGLPFVVRTLEPIVMDLPREAEEVAATLGATRAQTVVRVVLPALLPALLFLPVVLAPPLNHDVAAVLDFSQRWLGGEHLYSDLIDVNPPLIFVLNLIPAGLASWTKPGSRGRPVSGYH